MAKINKSIFIANHQNQGLDTASLAKAAQKDTKLGKQIKAAGLDVSEIKNADRNHDGIIDAKETWGLAVKPGSEGNFIERFFGKLFGALFGFTPSSTNSESQNAKTLNTLHALMQRPDLKVTIPSPTISASATREVVQSSTTSGQAARIDWAHPEIMPVKGVTLPSQQALTAGINAYNNAKKKGLVRNQKLTLIDYSLPANKPRMWIIDMRKNKLLAQHFVTHGKKSNDPNNAAMATQFSDKSGSNKTSLGTYIIGNSYDGNYGGPGESTFVRGLEDGLNKNANDRTIRIHPWPNVSDEAAEKYNNIATTEGCFGINEEHAREMVGMVRNGSVMLAYSDNDANFLAKSKYIK
ncbi:murein L,D-transpeptidase catalytic domain family protein [Myxococcota bacterium]|nr:murein L,D-transpeptidase catalytic domain family protein [Myxococcota bacterium]